MQSDPHAVTVFFSLLAASLMAALGAGVAARLHHVSHERLCVLISFAAGALLAVAIFDIFPEAVELSGWPLALLSFGSGYALFFLITRFVFHVCPACAATHTEVNFKAVTTAMLAALSVHSFADGLAVWSGVRSGEPGGWLVLLAVAYHKFPEGMALTLVAIASGISRPRAFLLAALIESLTTFAGGLVGIFAAIPASSPWLGGVMGHIGGGFVFLVIHALLSETLKHHPRNTMLAALAGAASILGIGYWLGAF